ncbi:MAG: hypothetical protein JWO31_3612 [Phycisphaerales bacterium]|nr:hypothetical protein [Phycisphaerales bacterium]
MTWHWSYKSLPELAGLTDAEKRALVLRLRNRAEHRRPFLVVTAAAGALPFLLLAVGAEAGGPGVLRWASGAVVAAGLAALVLWDQVELRALRRLLLRELPGRCRGCGYDLTGNASGACPGCGRAA